MNKYMAEGAIAIYRSDTLPLARHSRNMGKGAKDPGGGGGVGSVGIILLRLGAVVLQPWGCGLTIAGRPGKGRPRGDQGAALRRIFIR